MVTTEQDRVIICFNEPLNLITVFMRYWFLAVLWYNKFPFTTLLLISVLPIFCLSLFLPLELLNIGKYCFELNEWDLWKVIFFFLMFSVNINLCNLYTFTHLLCFTAMYTFTHILSFTKIYIVTQLLSSTALQTFTHILSFTALQTATHLLSFTVLQTRTHLLSFTAVQTAATHLLYFTALQTAATHLLYFTALQTATHPV
jgi:hypothetical protein